MGIFFKLGTANIAITTLVTVGLYFAFTFYITTYRVNVRRDLIDADNAVSEKSIDTLINYETVKMFGMEQEEVQSYHDLQHTNQEKQIFFRLTLNFLNLGQSFIQYGGVGLTMIFAARGAVYGTLTPGDFVLVNQYVMQLFMPLFFLGSSYRIISQAMTDLEKCMELYHTEITVKDSDSAVDWGSEYSDGNKVEAEGRVSFQNVSFKYEGSQRGEKGGLRNVSFDVAPGKMVAFVGASGTGKRYVPSFIFFMQRCTWASVQILRCVCTDLGVNFFLYSQHHCTSLASFLRRRRRSHSHRRQGSSVILAAFFAKEHRCRRTGYGMFQTLYAQFTAFLHFRIAQC